MADSVYAIHQIL